MTVKIQKGIIQIISWDPPGWIDLFHCDAHADMTQITGTRCEDHGHELPHPGQKMLTIVQGFKKPQQHSEQALHNLIHKLQE